MVVHNVCQVAMELRPTDSFFKCRSLRLGRCKLSPVSTFQLDVVVEQNAMRSSCTAGHGIRTTKLDIKKLFWTLFSLSLSLSLMLGVVCMQRIACKDPFLFLLDQRQNPPLLSCSKIFLAIFDALQQKTEHAGTGERWLTYEWSDLLDHMQIVRDNVPGFNNDDGGNSDNNNTRNSNNFIDKIQHLSLATSCHQLGTNR